LAPPPPPLLLLPLLWEIHSFSTHYSEDDSDHRSECQDLGCTVHF
jgi:hypothetical protein